MTNIKNVNVGTCVNCNEFNFPSRKCLKSVITEPMELKEALMPKNCEYYSSVSFIDNGWNWKNGLILGDHRNIVETVFVSLFLIFPLILANFINIIVIREILVVIPLFISTMLLISLRGGIESIKKRQTLSKRVLWYEALVRFIGLVIVLFTVLNIYSVLEVEDYPSLVLIGLTIFTILNYFCKYPVPLNRYFTELNREFYDKIQHIIRKDPWRIFIPLNNYKEDKPHPLFLGIALNSFENLHEEISLPIIKLIVQNYWEDVFPEIIKNMLEDGKKRAPVGAVMLLAQKKDEIKVIDFIIDIPTMSIPLKQMKKFMGGLLGTGNVNLRILIKRLGEKSIVSEEMWGNLLAIKPLESREILNEEINMSEGIKKDRYKKILEYLEKTEKPITEKESRRPDISSAKAEFEIALKEMQKEDYESSITHLNDILSKYPKATEVKLLAYSLLSSCYVQLEKYDAAYSLCKILFSTSMYEPKLGDYISKIVCEIKLKLPGEFKATLKEARGKFPNHPELDDPKLQIIGELVSTIPETSAGSASEPPTSGTTIKSVPSDEIFKRVQQKFKSMVTDDREKNVEVSQYFSSCENFMTVKIDSENEEEKPPGMFVIREGNTKYVSDETFLNIFKASPSLVVFSEFGGAYEQIKVAFQDEKYIPAAEDYLVKIICEIELQKHDEALTTLREINRIEHIRNHKKIKEFGLDLFSNVKSVEKEEEELTYTVDPSIKIEGKQLEKYRKISGEKDYETLQSEFNKNPDTSLVYFHRILYENNPYQPEFSLEEPIQAINILGFLGLQYGNIKVLRLLKNIVMNGDEVHPKIWKLALQKMYPYTEDPKFLKYAPILLYESMRGGVKQGKMIEVMNHPDWKTEKGGIGRLLENEDAQFRKIVYKILISTSQHEYAMFYSALGANDPNEEVKMTVKKELEKRVGSENTAALDLIKEISEGEGMKTLNESLMGTQRSSSEEESSYKSKDDETTTIIVQKKKEELEEEITDETLQTSEYICTYIDRIQKDERKFIIELSQSMGLKEIEEILLKGSVTIEKGHITKLKFRHHQLTTLPDSIRKLTNLTELCLGVNQFTTIPDSISELTKLTRLEIWGSQITKLPNFMGQMNQLTRLHMWGNQITTLPSTIGDWNHLTELRMSRNKLKSIPNSIGELKRLTELDLGDNQLTSLPESFGRLTKLESLRVANNQLTTIPDEIGRMTLLTELNCYGNQLTTLPETIGKLTNLRRLYMAKNILTTLPESIGKLTKLGYVDLGLNQLTTLPESFGQLKQLSHLEMQGNKLTALPESFGQLSELTHLEVQENQLTTLPESFGRLKQLSTLKAGKNPFVSLPESIKQIPMFWIMNASSRDFFFSLVKNDKN